MTISNTNKMHSLIKKLEIAEVKYNHAYNNADKYIYSYLMDVAKIKRQIKEQSNVLAGV